MLYIKTVFIFFVHVFIFSSVSAQVGDSSKWIANGDVNTVFQYGNKIYLGGQFNYLGPYTGGGVIVDSTTSLVAPDFPKVYGAVYAIIPDGTGGWYMLVHFQKWVLFYRATLHISDQIFLLIHRLSFLRITVLWL